jgi:hypothetical protein
MSLTTANADEVVVETADVPKEPEVAKAPESKPKVMKAPTEPEAKSAIPLVDVPKKDPVIRNALIFIAQRSLDAPGFEDFKQLYPALFD